MVEFFLKNVIMCVVTWPRWSVEVTFHKFLGQTLWRQKLHRVTLIMDIKLQIFFERWWKEWKDYFYTTVLQKLKGRLWLNRIVRARLKEFVKIWAFFFSAIQSTYYMEGDTGHRVFQTQFGEWQHADTLIEYIYAFNQHLSKATNFSALFPMHDLWRSLLWNNVP